MSSLWNKLIPPTTWTVTFPDRDTAHQVYQHAGYAVVHALASTGVVNGDTWYVNTRMKEADFKSHFVRAMNQRAVKPDQYTLAVTRIGWGAALR
ncbi:hypothetical protein [Lacticaseibacillus thailandensis]|uniref:hypothetical protein n=1 Tax=Lacticaseibacillus thailandensis TaxID=381741 RepID=UPI0006D0ED67|nr:hypothetical protein [Lacticaseibacillus thailandensis]